MNLSLSITLLRPIVSSSILSFSLCGLTGDNDGRSKLIISLFHGCQLHRYFHRYFSQILKFEKRS